MVSGRSIGGWTAHRPARHSSRRGWSSFTRTSSALPVAAGAAKVFLMLREGARRMLMQVVEAEVEAFIAAHADLTDGQGRRRVVRNGHAPERHIQTGIGPLAVSRPRVRDRGGDGSGPVRFSSAVLPPYLRRARNVEELLPWLYLKGVSTGQ